MRTQLRPAIDRPAAPPTSVSIRALNSLRPADAAVVSLLLPCLGPNWCLAQHEDPDGDLTLVLGLDGDDDAPSFALHRTAAGVHLAAVRDDGWERLGCFASPAAALAHLRRVLRGEGAPQSLPARTPA